MAESTWSILTHAGCISSFFLPVLRMTLTTPPVCFLLRLVRAPDPSSTWLCYPTQFSWSCTFLLPQSKSLANEEDPYTAESTRLLQQSGVCWRCQVARLESLTLVIPCLHIGDHHVKDVAKHMKMTPLHDGKGSHSFIEAVSLRMPKYEDNLTAMIYFGTVFHCKKLSDWAYQILSTKVQNL